VLARIAAASVAALARCPPAPTGPERARVEATHQAAREVRPRSVVLPRASGEPCPVAFPDADVVLARAGDVTITACDVAVAAALATREGRAALSPRERLAEILDE